MLNAELYHKLKGQGFCCLPFCRWARNFRLFSGLCYLYLIVLAYVRGVARFGASGAAVTGSRVQGTAKIIF
jgi:hypothetical protein